MIEKACAVVLHPDGAPVRLLIFAHPKAGLQLVKGGLKAGETPLAAARRELFEESGLVARSGVVLGQSKKIRHGQRWHFALLRVAPPVADRWKWRTADGGGHDFAFHWVMLSDNALSGRYARALAFIRGALS